jgi:hypothetical protein
MGTFWLKVAIVLAAVIAGAVVVTNFLSRGVEHATDIERMEDLRRAQDAGLDDELAAAERRAEQPPPPAPAPPEPPPVRPPRTAEPPPGPVYGEMSEEDLVAAERLYQMAYSQYKIGRLPGTTFKKMVDYCRELFERYPDSPQAAKARVLMRNMPERFKKMYNVTDEEMGLSG